MLGSQADRLGTGTARNEQLHHEQKSWMRNIRMAHEDRLRNGLSIFMFAKLLTHSSAAYFPTLCQTSQSRLLFILSVKLPTYGIFPTPNIAVNSISSPINSRDHLHVNVPTNAGTAITRASKRKLENVMWKKRQIPLRPSVRSYTDIFRRPRVDIRDRVFKRKTTSKKC